MKNIKRDVARAFRTSLPVLAGYLVLGSGFGILLESRGFGFPWALGMSVFLYAGAMQYLMVDLLAGGASILVTAVTTLAVQARHLFYGLSMIEKYRGAGKRKIYMIHAITDETYSLHCAENGEGADDPHTVLFFISLFDHIYWILGGLLGVLIGSLLPFDMKGVDFSLTALFVTIFIDQWRSRSPHLPAVIGITSTLLSLLIFGKDAFLIPAMILIVVLLLLCRARITRAFSEVTPDA